MFSSDRSSIIIAVFLICLGVLFLLLTVIPSCNIGGLWPIIFFILAAGFYLPSIAWPAVRKELAALFIPGSLMLILGFIFFYNAISKDWAVWAYAWLLIPGSIGLGMLLSSWIGEWGKSAMWTGIWMMIASVTLFSLFGVLFGNPFVKTVAPLLLVGGGFILLANTFKRPS